MQTLIKQSLIEKELNQNEKIRKLNSELGRLESKLSRLPASEAVFDMWIEKSELEKEAIENRIAQLDKQTKKIIAEKQKLTNSYNAAIKEKEALESDNEQNLAIYEKQVDKYETIIEYLEKISPSVDPMVDSANIHGRLHNAKGNLARVVKKYNFLADKKNELLKQARLTEKAINTYNDDIIKMARIQADLQESLNKKNTIIDEYKDTKVREELLQKREKVSAEIKRKKNELAAQKKNEDNIRNAQQSIYSDMLRKIRQDLDTAMKTLNTYIASKKEHPFLSFLRELFGFIDKRKKIKIAKKLQGHITRVRNATNTFDKCSIESLNGIGIKIEAIRVKSEECLKKDKKLIKEYKYSKSGGKLRGILNSFKSEKLKTIEDKLSDVLEPEVIETIKLKPRQAKSN